MSNQITTIKLRKETKRRLEKLKEHPRETYDDIIRKMLFILNTVKKEPEEAKEILERIDELRKRMIEEKLERGKNGNIKQ